MMAAKVNLKIIVIDYLQLMPTLGRKNRNEELGDITRRLKLLSQELRVPIFLLSQLNRNNERENRPPRMSDLRDSGSIEQDADSVMLLHRPHDQDPISPYEFIDVILAKHRNGPVGEFPLRFEKGTFRFTDALGA